MITEFKWNFGVRNMTDWDKYKLLVSIWNRKTYDVATVDDIAYHGYAIYDDNKRFLSVHYPDDNIINYIIAAMGSGNPDIEKNARNYFDRRHSLAVPYTIGKLDIFAFQTSHTFALISGEEVDTPLFLVSNDSIFYEADWSEELTEMALDPLVFDLWPWSKGFDGLGHDWEPGSVSVRAFKAGGKEITKEFVEAIVGRAMEEGLADDDESRLIEALTCDLP